MRGLQALGREVPGEFTIIPDHPSAAPNSVFPRLETVALRAFERLGGPLYIYSFGTQRVCWSNASAREFWNAESDEELRGRDLTPFSEATTIRLAEWLAAFRQGESRLETWTYYPKGVATTALVRSTGVSLDGHDEAMLVEIRALAHAELPISELRAIEALRHTPLKISLLSIDGEVLMRNPAAQARFGTLDHALDPRDDHFRAMFANPADFEELLHEATASGYAFRTATMALEGAPVHAIQLQMVSDPGTGSPALLVAQQDISRLQELSRQLAASEDALEAVLSLNVAPALVLSVGDGKVLQANFAAQALLGPGIADEGGANRLFAEPAQYDTLRGAILAGGAGTVQMRLRAATGEPFWASVSGARISFEKQDAIVVLLTDVNQLYQTAADLETALDLERRISSTQRRFLAIASHELRTPLAVIDGAAQRLERNAGKMAVDEIRHRATRVRATVKRLLQLLDNTIEQARNNAGAMGYTPETVQLGDVIEATAKGFREHHPRASLSLDLPALPLLRVDPALMEQALDNLLSNAVKYTAGDAEISVSAIVTADEVEIVVRDNGIGIPAEERERVFADYVRGSNVGLAPGTGLGLSIVRQIVGLHGGHVEVLDSVGPGTAIRITLPRP